MVRISSPDWADHTRTAWSLQIAATRWPAPEIVASSADAPGGKLSVFSCRPVCAQAGIARQQSTNTIVRFGRIKAAQGTDRNEPRRALRLDRPSASRAG